MPYISTPEDSTPEGLPDEHSTPEGSTPEGDGALGEGAPEGDWDGVIRHKEFAGASGYKRHRCRCPGCCAAGEAIRLRKRELDKAKRRGEGGEFTHGLNGYRLHKCRCEDCSVAGAKFLREAGSRPRARTGESSPPAVDWSDVEYLRPGVRRRFGS